LGGRNAGFQHSHGLGYLLLLGQGGRYGDGMLCITVALMLAWLIVRAAFDLASSWNVAEFIIRFTNRASTSSSFTTTRMNNLLVHYLTGLRDWLVQRGIEVLFLPPYSPDFTPTEQA
jgi:hypothetical protein